MPEQSSLSHWLWQKTAGDNSEFKFTLFFAEDPDGGAGATPEEALSWGGFELWVEGKNLCFHLEQQQTFNAVHWYLLPMLEWFALNWNELFHEERLPNKNAGEDAWLSLDATYVAPVFLTKERATKWEEHWHDWWGRHSLRACRNGGLFPDIVLRRWQDKVEISWANSEIAGAPDYFRFLFLGGYARLEPQKVAESLYEVLVAASDYLSSRLPNSQRILALLSAVRSIPETQHERRLALMVGLGEEPDMIEEKWAYVRKQFPAMPHDLEEAVFGVNGHSLVTLGTCQAALMFGSVSPTIDETDILTLAQQLVGLYAPGAQSAYLSDLIREYPVDKASDSPWNQGYELAEEVVEALAALTVIDSNQQWIDIDTVYTKLSIETRQIDLHDKEIRAVAIASPKHRAAVLINTTHEANKYPSGKRFTLAHELCHLIFDRSYGRQLAIASGPWAPVDLEKRANAFAAMFLMPQDLVRRAIASLQTAVDSVDGVLEIAKTLHMSFTATVEHLTNQGFLSEAGRDRLREQVEQKIS